jgi:3-methylcrotonyl-CoA carboxylase alpha subunit
MTIFSFRDDPAKQHHVQRRPGALRVAGTDQRVQAQAAGTYAAHVDGHAVRVHAVADGDTIHLHLNGRAWRIERVDPTRAAAGTGSQGAGDAHAPMPGAVISWVAQPGSRVREGDALLVIESMKLQMTITAGRDGILEALPVEAGKTFQRGAVLARIRPEGESA